MSNFRTIYSLILITFFLNSQQGFPQESFDSPLLPRELRAIASQGGGLFNQYTPRDEFGRKRTQPIEALRVVLLEELRNFGDGLDSPFSVSRDGIDFKKQEEIMEVSGHPLGTRSGSTGFFQYGTITQEADSCRTQMILDSQSGRLSLWIRQSDVWPVIFDGDEGRVRSGNLQEFEREFHAGIHDWEGVPGPRIHLELGVPWWSPNILAVASFNQEAEIEELNDGLGQGIKVTQEDSFPSHCQGDEELVSQSTEVIFRVLPNPDRNRSEMTTQIKRISTCRLKNLRRRGGYASWPRTSLTACTHRSYGET